MKIICNTLIALSLLSCMPKPLIAPARVITELKLNEDIGVYSGEIVDLDSPKVYNVNGRYYFGDFYYINDDTVYALDVSNSRMIVSSREAKRQFPLEYGGLENSKISLIDDYGNVYITVHNLRYIDDVFVTNVSIVLPSEAPTVEGDDSPRVETYTVTVTNTNYTKVELISLNKISSDGEFLYEIDSIIDDEYESLVKLFPLTNDKFAVLKRDRERMPILSVYDMNTGEMEKSHTLSEIEYFDSNSMSYREIIDCVYVSERSLVAILAMNIENGLHSGDLIYTSDINDFNLKETYKIPSRDNSLAVGISRTGRVTYTGIDDGTYFFIRTNPFLSQNYGKEYIGTDGFNKLRGIRLFDDSIYGFLVEEGNIRFQNY